MAKAQVIRQALTRYGQLIMPGVYDALSAKIAARAGFEVTFITGYSLSATLLGEPDFGLLTQTEVVSAAQRICSVIDIPVIVDADTGYGNAINVIRTVQDLIRAGAGGMFLEDQVWPKRCGHMRGKQVIPLEEQLNKLRAAVEARGQDDFFIVARTDSRQALGLEEAIKRGIAFKNAGADAVFIEAPESKEEMREIAKHVQRPSGGKYVGAWRNPADGAGGIEGTGLRLGRLAAGATLFSGEIADRCLYDFAQGRIDAVDSRPLDAF